MADHLLPFHELYDFSMKPFSVWTHKTFVSEKMGQRISILIVLHSQNFCVRKVARCVRWSVKFLFLGELSHIFLHWICPTLSRITLHVNLRFSFEVYHPRETFYSDAVKIHTTMWYHTQILKSQCSGMISVLYCTVCLFQYHSRLKKNR